MVRQNNESPAEKPPAMPPEAFGRGVGEEENGRRKEGDKEEKEDNQSERQPENQKQGDSEDKNAGDKGHIQKKANSEKKEKEDPRPFYKRPILMTVLIGVAVIGIVGGTIYLVHEHYHPSTDDAFIDGRIVHVGPRVAGKVLTLNVTDNQWVDADTVLIEIDPSDYKVRLEQAQATLGQDEGKLRQARATLKLAEAQIAQAQADVVVAEANATNAELDYQRYVRLTPEARTKQQLDAATAAQKATAATVEASRKKEASAEAQADADSAAIEAAQGQVASDQAQVDQAQLNLGYTKVVAGQPGWITRRTVEVGNFVQVGQDILYVVSPDIWVTANYKETQLRHMRPGQPAMITVDAYPDEKLHGHVDSIQAGSGEVFSLLPPENATGNYVKVVQRLPVKIVLDEQPRHVLAPGMSVEPAVDIGSTPQETQTPLHERDAVGNRSGVGNQSGTGYGGSGRN